MENISSITNTNDNTLSNTTDGNINEIERKNKIKTKMDEILKIMKMFPVVVAPMVGHSELPFRMLCRKYGAKICYTPMINSKLFVEQEHYRNRFFRTCFDDRPLVVQFCGHDPNILLKAAKMVEDKCDAVDLNAGCPQQIAKKGYYGAFLLENCDLMEEIVKVVSSGLSIPFFCKVRLLPTGIEPSINLYKRLQNAGASLITVHGRTRLENKFTTGKANWDAIKLAKQSLNIPVVANGGMENLDDVNRCLEYTGCDGAMTAEALLDSPALFYPDAPKNPIIMSLEYLELCKKHGETDNKDTRSHIFKFLASMLMQHPTYYKLIGASGNLENLESVVKDIGRVHGAVEGFDGEICKNPDCFKHGGYYFRHRTKKEKRKEKCADGVCGELNENDDSSPKRVDKNEKIESDEINQLKRDNEENCHEEVNSDAKRMKVSE